MSICIYAILMMSAIGIIFPINVNPSESCADSPSYSAHDPIYIDGNADFIVENGVTNGAGTESDPYIIEGWDINTSSSNSVDIRNTTAYFIIRNCYVHNGWTGIYFHNVTNGQVDNTISYNNGIGIHLHSSSNNNISNNSVNSNNGIGIHLLSSNNNIISNNNASNNQNGIHLWSSINNTISNNSINSSNWYGIYIGCSSYSTLVNNILKNNGVFILGDMNEFFSTHNISTTNTANGKPIYYYKNQNDIHIDGWNAGQVILANCTNFTINNVDCSNASVGIELSYCNYCSIEDCILNNGSYGIYLEYSNNSNIFNNRASSNRGIGIYVYHSSNNNIYNNSINSSDWYGIYLGFSNDNKFISNNISYNNYSVGIYSSDCENNIFHHNNFFNGTVVNVVDNGENTEWDDSYGEGNYWSNYIGLDDGSNERVAGDGVGDTNIPHMGLDSYPLMELVEQPYTPDSTPPLISSVVVSEIMENATVITWTTDELSDSGVSYSINSNLSFKSTQYNSTLTTFHSIILIGLNQSTTYYFEVTSTDKYGNTITDTNNSGYYSFTTLEDMTPPATPIGLTLTSLRNGDLNITWNLNTDDTQTYSIYSNKTGTWALMVNVTHPQNWYEDSGLTSGTTYYYKISAWDEVPLESSKSGVVHGVSSPIGIISGVVKDEYGNPIESADIIIFVAGNTDKPVIFYTTYSNGEYSVNVTIGVYDIKVEKSGYKTQWRKDVEVTTDQTTTIDFTLPLTFDTLKIYWLLIPLIIVIIVILIAVTIIAKKKKVVEEAEKEEGAEEVEESEMEEEDEVEEEKP